MFSGSAALIGGSRGATCMHRDLFCPTAREEEDRADFAHSGGSYCDSSLTFL